jgi:tRNA(Ile)-lysidine synthase
MIDVVRVCQAQIPPDCARVLVACSGGVDSMSLLHAVYQICGAKVVAVHVNHHLQPEADRWQAFCQQWCECQHIPFLACSVQVERKDKGLEAAAREARMQVLERCVEEGDVVLLAHHQDDQVETVLLRLMRGSGPVGLAAMRRERVFGKGMMLRPWLDVPRAAIVDYARRHQLTWVEDSSNASADFDRNFLRHDIIPKLKTRWPGLGKAVARSALLCDESVRYRPKNTATTLECTGWNDKPEADQRQQVYQWLSSLGVTMPAFRVIAEIAQQAVSARADATPCISWAGGEVRRFAGRLYYLDPKSLSVPEPLNRQVGNLKYDDIQVRYYQGGEKIRLHGHTRRLKKLFQEARIPPWERCRIPLVFVNGELQQVGDLWQV